MNVSMVGSWKDLHGDYVAQLAQLYHVLEQLSDQAKSFHSIFFDVRVITDDWCLAIYAFLACKMFSSSPGLGPFS